MTTTGKKTPIENGTLVPLTSDGLPVSGGKLLAAGKRNVISITCAECGHDWRGRFKKDEWSDWVEPEEEQQ